MSAHDGMREGRKGGYNRRLLCGMTFKGAGILLLKEGGSTGLEVPTRNKGEHLSRPLDLWDIRGKKHTTWRLQVMQYQQRQPVFSESREVKETFKEEFENPGD